MEKNEKTAILLVEDQVLIAMMEKMELERKGYCVHMVSDGEKAVQSVLDNALSIDLILMDIDLGAGIDGTQAAEQILRHKDIPIVFLSSQTEPDVVAKTERITSYGYVVKNSGIVVLDASIKMALKLFNAKLAHKKAEEELLVHREQLETLVEKRTTELGKEMLEKEKAIAMLKESELKYRNIVDNSTSVILEWDTDGTILYMNRYGLEYFGYGEKEIIGKKVVGTIVSPKAADGYNLQAKMEVVPKNPEDYYSSENENIRKNGEKVWIAWTNKGIRDGKGNLIKTLSLGIDRTAQKQLENRLEYLKELNAVNNRLEEEIAVRRKTEEKYRFALEATQEGLWDWDIKTGKVYYSPAYFTMLGYEAVQDTLTCDFWIGLIHPDDKERTLRINSECIEGAFDTFSVDFRMKAIDGTWRYIQGKGKCVSRDTDGRALRMVGTHTDITQRKYSDLMVTGLNDCFLAFSADPDSNIDMLVVFLGSRLGGSCALYNRIVKGMIRTIGQWNIPPGHKETDYPDGRICNDIIHSANKGVSVIANLENTTYALTDPNVGRYGLKTYMGISVKRRSRNIGVVCVAHQTDFYPNDIDKRLMEMVASAIGVEESRRHAQGLLKKKRRTPQLPGANA